MIGKMCGPGKDALRTTFCDALKETSIQFFHQQGVAENWHQNTRNGKNTQPHAHRLEKVVEKFCRKMLWLEENSIRIQKQVTNTLSRANTINETD